jgi:uncharacterized protein YkwD
MGALGSLLDFLGSLRHRKPAPSPAPSGPQPSAALLVRSINLARAAYGFRPLATDPGLSASIGDWVSRCAANGVMIHGNFAGRVGSVHPNTAAGENLAEGYPDADSVVAGWMGDPPHRANVLGNWNLVGCGWAVARDGTVFAGADFDLM